MAYLDDTLKKRLLFLTGKGGVGKSTVAWATALAAKRRGHRVAVVGWQPLGKDAPAGAGLEAWDIPWIGLETLAAFREYALTLIRFETLYDSVLDNRVLRTFIHAAPGLADSVVAGKIWDLVDKAEYDLIIVDMPSSGHAKSFFQSPLGLKRVFKVGFIARDAKRVCDLFAAPTTRLDLVTLPEDLPLTECQELKQALSSLHAFHFGFLHTNRCLPGWVAVPQEAVPESLPPAHAAFFAQMRERYDTQRDTLEKAGTILDSRIEIPLCPLATWEAVVEAVAAQMLEEAA